MYLIAPSNILFLKNKKEKIINNWYVRYKTELFVQWKFKISILCSIDMWLFFPFYKKVCHVDKKSIRYKIENFMLCLKATLFLVFYFLNLWFFFLTFFIYYLHIALKKMNAYINYKLKTNSCKTFFFLVFKPVFGFWNISWRWIIKYENWWVELVVISLIFRKKKWYSYQTRLHKFIG